jgi:ribosome biogenesis protein Tsr3
MNDYTWGYFNRYFICLEKSLLSIYQKAEPCKRLEKIRELTF